MKLKGKKALRGQTILDVINMASALDKASFMSGVRQKWLALIMVSFFVVLFVDAISDIDSGAYLEFLMIFTAVGIGGLSMSAWNKERAAMKPIRRPHAD